MDPKYVGIKCVHNLFSVRISNKSNLKICYALADTHKEAKEIAIENRDGFYCENSDKINFKNLSDCWSGWDFNIPPGINIGITPINEKRIVYEITVKNYNGFVRKDYSTITPFLVFSLKNILNIHTNYIYREIISYIKHVHFQEVNNEILIKNDAWRHNSVYEILMNCSGSGAFELTEMEYCYVLAATAEKAQEIVREFNGCCKKFAVDDGKWILKTPYGIFNILPDNTERILYKLQICCDFTELCYDYN